MHLLFLLILFLLNPLHTYGQDEFKVSQEISYNIDINGTAFVKQDITLTNKISQIYAKEYTISMTPGDVKNLTVSNSEGVLPATSSKEKDTLNILIKFPNPAIGKDQHNSFQLQYTIPNFGNKKGKTWELQFPTFVDSHSDQLVNTTLSVPESFGELSFSSIPIQNSHLIGDTNQIKFGQSKLSNKVLLVFGNHQLFDFELKYFLSNSTNGKTLQSIPIPPDTNTQSITFKEFNPKPEHVTTDADGNWMAAYLIDPAKSLDITITGQAKVHPHIPNQVSPNTTELTAPKNFWEVDSPEIKLISSTLKTSSDIYDYVVNTLSYDYNQINSARRKGALGALQSPQNSLCTEFTDLFVTISRSKGIPAREIEGFAYSNNSRIKPTNPNSDILHAWPEYFDKNSGSWKQIDPTWEKTTNGIDFFSELDLNHITFVIHGQNSNSPPPPGAYKKDNSSKSVLVEFAKSELKREVAPLNIYMNGSDLIIENPNQFSSSTTTIRSNNLNWQENVNPLPPLGKTKLTPPSVSFLNSLLPKNTRYDFEVEVTDGSAKKFYNFINRNHYLNVSIFTAISVFILCLGGIILTTSHKRHEKNS